MKKLTCLFIICLLTSTVSFALAESKIPSLVGTWKVQTEGGALIKADKASTQSHHGTKFTKFEAEFVVEKQKGRVFHGYFKSARATEKLVGVIGHDNKTAYWADHDGFGQAKILSSGKMQVIYLHASPTESVAAAATFTKNK
ncbi:hypothetical protein ACFL2Q_00820 [Thermodesulfobacteriota bacterium]